ncbi:tetratricopeptide repeat protein [candidate division TA06 bacterium]|nr:tetratricopeptide repeat protein [candidate division TA06 bacterium]
MDKEKKIRLIVFFAVFGVVLSVYLWTIAPTVAFWDNGEFIACSYILGVPHPPGTPLQVLIGKIFSFLPISNEIAYRVNFFSVFSGAMAAAFIYLLVVKVIGNFKGTRVKNFLLLQHTSGIVAGLVGAFSYTVWDNSVEAEVYSPSNLITVLITWIALIWYENIGKKGNKNLLLLSVYLLTLSIGVHLAPLLVAPGFLLLFIFVDRKGILDSKLLLALIPLIFLGISTYFYLIIRAHFDPGINEVNPRDFRTLWEVFTRKQYGPSSLLPRRTQLEGMGLIPAYLEQLKLYAKYYSWQFAKFPRSLIEPLTEPSTWLKFLSIVVTWLFTSLGLFGLWTHFRKEKKTFLLLGVTFLFTSLGLLTYLNMKYSPSDPNPLHLPHEVRERDYFFSPSFLYFAFFIGIGTWGLLQEIGRHWRKGISIAVVTFLLLTLFPLLSNIRSHVNRRGDWIPDDYAHNLLISCDESSILFTNGDNDTFPLWFIQEVKGFKKWRNRGEEGVMVANLSLLNTYWYIKQLKGRGVPFSFSDYEIDNLRPYPMLDQEGNVIPGKNIFVKDIAVRDILATNRGIKFEKKILLPIVREKIPNPFRRLIPERLVLVPPGFYQRVLPDSLWMRIPLEYIISPEEFAKKVLPGYEGEKNIFFAVTVSRENIEGFNPYLEMEGMVYRVVGTSGQAGRINVEKTRKNLEDLYRYRSIFDDNVYKDSNTQKLFSNYVAGWLRLSTTLVSQGDLKGAVEAAEMAVKFPTEQRNLLVQHLAELYIRTGETDKAEERLEEVIQADPNAPRSNYQLGQIYEQRGRMEEARQAYERVIEKSPNEPLGYSGLLPLLKATGDNEAYLETMKKATQTSTLVSNLVHTFLNLNPDTTLARDILEEWLLARPNDPAAKRILENLNKGQ